MLAKGPSWEQHARHFDSIFGQEDKTRLSEIRAFSQERLTEKQQTMLYMFSGPDFLYAVSFFPSATTYVLSGLEPVGDVPQLTGLARPAVDSTLHNIESALGSLLNISFFITKDMKTQLQAGPVYGTLPILYVFLARTGKTIHDVSFVNLDAEGNIETPPAPGDKAAAKSFAQSGAKGVKIVFSDGDGPNKTLYYFSTNLADDGVKTSGFLQFCDKLGVADSFFKSASYSGSLQQAPSTRCAISFSTAARRSFRTTPVFRWSISTPKNGGSSHLATIWVRFPNSPRVTSPR